MKLKPIIFVFAFLSCRFAGYAQPVFNSQIKISSAYSVMNFDTTGINPGNAGENVIWDFSKQASLNTSSTVKFMPADSCPGSKNFPKADIALPTGSDRYIFYDTASGWSKVGQYYNEKVATVITYSDFQKLGKGPYKYKYHFSDDFLGKYTGPKGNAERIGKYSKTIDGYGTLITPAGTFKNVLRVRVTENIQDEFTTGGLKISTDVIMYQWIAEGFSYPLMTIYESRIKNSSGNYTFIYRNANY
ncbi:MAG: hypothetical protein ACJ75J_09385, partial [Cytophagaceae bacterium]